MLDVKEPITRKPSRPSQGLVGRSHPGASAQGRPQGPSTSVNGRLRYADPVVTPRSTANAAVPKRRPGDHVRLTPSPTHAPAVKRGRKQMDRLVQREAKLVAAAVICMTIVCASLIVYLTAYAQVSSLGIQMSKARVELRKQRQTSEMLRAQVARAASPDRIAAAAVKNGMVLEHTQQIAYVDPAGVGAPTQNQLTAQSVPAVQGGQQTTIESGATSPQSGTRMASRGANTDTSTTAPVVN